MLSADIGRLYELLGILAAQPGQGRALSEYTGRSPWPKRGVYFFREPGEHRSALPSMPRIVRVGTHAVSAGSKSSLWGRLRAHRGSQEGGGNHRGSIFRLHVGAALLERDREVIGELPTWAEGSSAPKVIRASEATHERRVSEYIGTMSVLWVDVPDEPGPESRRAYIERNAIALLSNGLEPLDPPSDGWLGLCSPRAAIRRSGLWNLNHVDERYDSAFLDALAEFVPRVGGP
jgi:hypothetical protein